MKVVTQELDPAVHLKCKAFDIFLLLPVVGKTVTLAFHSVLDKIVNN